MFKPVTMRVGFFLALFVSMTLQAQVPEWIWHNNDGAKAGDNEVRYFRKTFQLEKKSSNAILSVNADDEAEVWVNGTKQLSAKGWNAPTSKDVSESLVRGENVISVLGKTGSGEAAILVKLQIGNVKRNSETIVSDTSWRAAKTEIKGWNQIQFEQGAEWTAAKSLGKAGVAPWGEVFKVVVATPAAELATLPGFKVEMLHSSTGVEGSWICMTTDHKGRLIISPQSNDQPLIRITLSKDGKIEKWETIAAPVRQAMGLLYAFESLYVNCTGPKGHGLYRLVDKNKNDQFEADEVQFLKGFAGEGEHGYHGLALGRDNKIYVINGNHTKVPEGVAPYSPHTHYDEDFLLPRQWDAGGHAVGILAPGGHVLRTDKDGTTWEVVLGGFRNAYDLDFNADGELFTFDSDMEWEWGMPWYKPTRILHSVSAAEFGWRSGSAKWPEYYADSLPATVDIGIGSPTGVKFGTGSNYPEKYRRAFYAMDWSYGRLVAVHLQPSGASYTATYENFVKGKPLNVTDLDFGKDGAMYFITGGRGTQSGLYRVSYVGPKTKEKLSTEELSAAKEGKKAREIRHALEAFHGSKHADAVAVAWPYLNSQDRFLRYAARIAIESQDVVLWKDRAINEKSVEGGLTALLALARVGGKETQGDLLMALKKFPLGSLSEAQQLAKLRVIQLSFIRQGRPSPDLAKVAIEKLNAQYPAASEALNRELVQLLVYLEAPDVVSKTFELIKKAKTQEEQLHYVFVLRNLKSGWTIEQRRDYFELLKQDFSTVDNNPKLVAWFADVGRDYTDGASFTKHLANIKKDAVALLSESEKAELAEVLSENAEKKVAEKKPARVRTFVKEWAMSDLEPKLDMVSKGRNFEKGKAAFEDAQCMACHRFGNEGGAVGPELTAAASKYSRRDILDSILLPSKVVSEQYQNETIYKKDGEDITGRVVDENADRVVVANNPFALDARVEIKKSDIAKRGPSKLSPMPEGLINTLPQEDILDMLAYIESMGKAKAANFKK